MAFQRYQGEVHPLPLGLNNETFSAIKTGEQFLPIDETGQPEALSEAEDTGHHHFIICIASEISKLPTKESPPQADAEVSTYTISIQFIG